MSVMYTEKSAVSSVLASDSNDILAKKRADSRDML
jgi:hypothetical protein